jgi:CheY-like chemotaxis protein
VSTGQASSLVSAVAELVGVLIWPTVLLFFLVRFRRPLATFLSNLSEFSFKAPGIEASAKRQQVEAAAALGAAAATRAPGDGGPGTDAQPQDIAAALPSPRAQRRMQGARVLWVDDRPDNNRYERQALEALGIDIDLSTSTEDAMEKIQRRSYDLIISDMGRPPDARAGYTLLDELRRSGNQTPYVIYASSRAPEHVREAREHGAIGSTNVPQELITIVTNALLTRQ